MTDFLQLHLLTSYPPANLNRDDLSRPKTAIFGGVQRLRISSQCLKRTWRTAAPFRDGVVADLGLRTKEIGNRIVQSLIQAGVEQKSAEKWAGPIVDQFGKRKKKSLETEQLVHYSPRELRSIDELCSMMGREQREATSEEISALLDAKTDAVDVALFGRMLAASPHYNVEAACQVAHAFSIHRVAVEDDYFTAVDDLNRGAGHLDELGFAAGLFYLYVCLDLNQLTGNLGDDKALAVPAVNSLVKTAATVAPRGKQNSFASRAYASFILAERGDAQPRSLAVAFLKPIAGSDLLANGIKAFEDTRRDFEKVYGPSAREIKSFDVTRGKGSLQEVADFASSRLPGV
ncbi:MAG: type I-E CRISPR-associated protein Cas7/Cse4/CasC [Planctomycetota bacterium]|nr:MAG: type I-E CRISPR-associated protein Cas7/Cse4/CasC [Planctomycetota bacterium]